MTAKTAADFLPASKLLEHGLDDPSEYHAEFLAFLKHNREKMVPFEDTGHDANLITLWNKFAKGSKMDEFETEYLLDNLFGTTMSFIDCFGDDISVERKIKAFHAFMDDGFSKKLSNGKLVHLPDCSQDCFKSGVRLRFGFPEPFRPVALQRYGLDFEPVTPIKDPGVQHFEIPCPSGVLIAADWIRQDEFTAFYRRQDEKKLISVCNDAGRIEHALRAGSLRMIDVMIDNGSAEIAQRGNTLVVCRRGDELEGFSKTGEICTVRWSFSCIDRQILEEILLSEGVKDPSKAVDDYLEESKRKHYMVSVLNVDPGNYHVYFTGNEQVFEKMFDCDEIPKRTGGNKALLVIADHELTLNAAPKAKKSKKP